MNSKWKRNVYVLKICLSNQWSKFNVNIDDPLLEQSISEALEIYMHEGMFCRLVCLKC